MKLDYLKVSFYPWFCYDLEEMYHFLLCGGQDKIFYVPFYHHL